MFRPLAIPLLAATLAACGSADIAADLAGETRTADTGLNAAPELDDADEDFGAADSTTPSWFALDGLLDLGGADALAMVGVAYFDDQQQPLCAHAVAGDGLEEPGANDLDPEDDVIDTTRWVRVVLQPQRGCGGAVAGAEQSLWLGVGPFDERLRPAMVFQDLERANPYGAYLRLDDGQEWLVGIAATDDQLDGLENPDTALPAPDDAYNLVPLYLAPWR